MRLLFRLLTAAAVTASVAPARAVTALDTTGTVYSTDRVVVALTFPVVGPTSFTDTFLACRSGCTRKHMGQDLMGLKMSPVVAACDGTVASLKREQSVGEGNSLALACDHGPATGPLRRRSQLPLTHSYWFDGCPIGSRAADCARSHLGH